MRKGLLIIYSCILFAACKSRNHVPDDVLPKEKMQAVLWDMMRADQFLRDYVFNKDSTLDKKIESIKLYRQIFDLHHVSKDEFQQSFAYYRSHPVLLKTIMDSLSNVKTVLSSVQKPRSDSSKRSVNKPD